MASIVQKTWDFTTGTLGWVGSAVGSETFSQDATNGIQVKLHGKNLTAAESSVPQGYTLDDTYQNIFGIGPRDQIVQIGVTGGADFIRWLCLTFTTGGTTHSAAGLQARAKAGGSFFQLQNPGVNFTTTTTQADQALNNILNPAAVGGALGGDTLSLWLWTQLSTGNSSSADMSVGYRRLTLTLQYNPEPPSSRPILITRSIPVDGPQRMLGENVDRSVPVPAGQTFPQDITATATTTAAITKQAGKIVSATATSTASFAKSVGKFITGNATSAASIVKSAGTQLSATATSTASIVASKAIGLALTATATSTAIISRSTGKIVSATSTTTATIVRQVGKIISGPATSTASIAKSVGLHLTGNATVTAVLDYAWSTIAPVMRPILITLKRGIGPRIPPAPLPGAAGQQTIQQALTATVTSTATSAVSVAKTVLATATSSASMVKTAGKTLSATATSTASILAQKAKLLTMTATATTTASISKNVGKPLQATATTTATIVKSIGKKVTATATSTASIAAQKAKLLTMTATATTTATVQRSVGKVLAATSTSSALIQKSARITLTALSSSSAAVRKVVGKSLSAPVSLTGSLVGNLIAVGHRILAAFGNSPQGSVTSRATEADYGNEPDAGVHSDPMESSYDRPNPESEVR